MDEGDSKQNRLSELSSAALELVGGIVKSDDEDGIMENVHPVGTESEEHSEEENGHTDAGGRIQSSNVPVIEVRVRGKVTQLSPEEMAALQERERIETEIEEMVNTQRQYLREAGFSGELLEAELTQYRMYLRRDHFRISNTASTGRRRAVPAQSPPKPATSSTRSRRSSAPAAGKANEESNGKKRGRPPTKQVVDVPTVAPTASSASLPVNKPAVLERESVHAVVADDDIHSGADSDSAPVSALVAKSSLELQQRAAMEEPGALAKSASSSSTSSKLKQLQIESSDEDDATFFMSKRKTPEKKKSSPTAAAKVSESSKPLKLTSSSSAAPTVKASATAVPKPAVQQPLKIPQEFLSELSPDAMSKVPVLLIPALPRPEDNRREVLMAKKQKEREEQDAAEKSKERSKTVKRDDETSSLSHRPQQIPSKGDEKKPMLEKPSSAKPAAPPAVGGSANTSSNVFSERAQRAKAVADLFDSDSDKPDVSHRSPESSTHSSRRVAPRPAALTAVLEDPNPPRKVAPALPPSGRSSTPPMVLPPGPQSSSHRSNSVSHVSNQKPRSWATVDVHTHAPLGGDDVHGSTPMSTTSSTVSGDSRGSLRGDSQSKFLEDIPWARLLVEFCSRRDMSVPQTLCTTVPLDASQRVGHVVSLSYPSYQLLFESGAEVSLERAKDVASLAAVMFFQSLSEERLLRLASKVGPFKESAASQIWVAGPASADGASRLPRDDRAHESKGSASAGARPRSEDYSRSRFSADSPPRERERERDRSRDPETRGREFGRRDSGPDRELERRSSRDARDSRDHRDPRLERDYRDLDASRGPADHDRRSRDIPDRDIRERDRDRGQPRDARDADRDLERRSSTERSRNWDRDRQGTDREPRDRDRHRDWDSRDRESERQYGPPRPKGPRNFDEEDLSEDERNRSERGGRNHKRPRSPSQRSPTNQPLGQRRSLDAAAVNEPPHKKSRREEAGPSPSLVEKIINDPAAIKSTANLGAFDWGAAARVQSSGAANTTYDDPRLRK